MQDRSLRALGNLRTATPYLGPIAKGHKLGIILTAVDIKKKLLRSGKRKDFEAELLHKEPANLSNYTLRSCLPC